MAYKLLDLDGLAERWGVSKAIATEIVRFGKVPYLPLRGNPFGRGRKTLRFRIESIEAWERDQEFREEPAGPDSQDPTPGGRKDDDGYTAEEREAMMAMGWDGERHV